MLATSPLTVSRQSSQQFKRASSVVWLELLLTLAVCGLLIGLAQPLATPGADLGLAQRYAGGIEPAHWPWMFSGALAPLSWAWLHDLYALRLWSALPQDLRAVALLRTAGYALALLGAWGWLALQLARSGRPWAVAIALAMWFALAWVLRPFQWPGYAWAVLASMALCGAGVAAVLMSKGGPRHKGSSTAPLNHWNACVWPGWLGLAGVGCLVALDFGAHGPVPFIGESPGAFQAARLRPGARYFGLHQLDYFWLSSGIVLATVALRTRLLQGLCNLCGGLDKLLQYQRGPWVVAALGLALALALGWLGYYSGGKRQFLGIEGWRGGGYPHVSGEVLRLLACAALAWFAYRSGEWRASPARLRTGLLRLFGVLTLCALGLVLSDDKGPLLILALSTSVLLAVPLLHRICATANARWAALGVLLACALALGLWRTALVDVLPKYCSPGSTCSVRDGMRTNAYAAGSPNLAQARWLMDAAPPTGFGLARVPYCGARAQAGLGTCTLGSGAPLQAPSDLPYTLLVASFGHWGAGGLVALLLAWLFTLVAGQLQAWRTLSGAALPLANQSGGNPAWAAHQRSLLPVWLVAVPSLAAQAQVVIGVGGTLGWSLLTGVTLPLLGYGGVALCVVATWVGLAAHAKPG